MNTIIICNTLFYLYELYEYKNLSVLSIFFLLPEYFSAGNEIAYLCYRQICYCMISICMDGILLLYFYYFSFELHKLNEY